MERVVITGIGAVSPLGNSIHDSWVAAKAGLSGIGPITRFNASEMRWNVAGELRGFDAGEYLFIKEINRLDPFARYAVAAATMAAEDAGLISHHSSLITHHSSLDLGGVIIGSSRGGIGTIEKELQKIYQSHDTHNSPHISAYVMPSTTISMASSTVAQKLGIKGYCLGISNACASGTNAIGEAYRLIRAGYQGPVLCGGAEAPVCRLCVEGYGISGALSRVNDPSASKPFDRTRDGFVIAEGACILVVENYENALRRGIRIYGEIAGYGNTTDAVHQTIPVPEGEARAIKRALDEAGLKPENIDYINAHGTSTPLGDKTETKAIKIVFGEKANRIPVSAVKSMTGHMLAASGALESAFTLMSMKEGVIPPTINLKKSDPECDLDYVTELRRVEIDIALSHSFGFGGVNAVLVFRRLSA
ncbi:MAG: beta-ketoacyl-ACP synthase II [Nitrospirota bacterium]|nr:beta-ketoacyl-ACP synthase II [Nitrospirota bacterium]MDH5768501.1 beta-ketoacyl-ACP synthase II [Nitrospirota bacterium]